MNYEEARNYVKLAEKKGSKLGLETIKRLMEELGNVQDKLNVLHIAGTNGKGSTLAYISEILKQAGYKVGKYTSPAVFDYLELFMINGEKIEEESYAECVSVIAGAAARLEKAGYDMPTGFEIETALAYLYFYREKCDIVLMEAGMGGDMDATNVTSHALLSIITPISLDHMKFLGNTIREIAEHKTGIIKKNSAVISAVQEESARTVIKEAAERNHSVCIQTSEPQNIIYESTGTTFNYQSESGIFFAGLEISMLGAFQTYNASVAVEAALYLRNNGFEISDETIRLGLLKTVWHGRFEKIGENPAVYFDGGHNPGAALYVRKSIEIYFTNRRIVYIIGVLADKDYESVLKITGELADAIITVTPHNARALDGRELLLTAGKYNENVSYAPSIKEAVDKAVLMAGTDGVVLVFGSLSYLNEMRSIFEVGSES